jgi:hypothetical protein
VIGVAKDVPDEIKEQLKAYASEIKQPEVKVEPIVKE